MTPKVALRGLRKVFTDSHAKRETVAVESFSLDIESGELVTLLGPSGCGKTTVLRMLAGFETPTSGSIHIDGKDVTYLPPNERNSAMVFQSYALFPHMSVLENITYGLKFRQVSATEKQKRLDRILEVVNLRGYEQRKPSELSGGQQQRVALARALIIEPALLLFDEPLSNLDAKLREFMRTEIRKVQKELGITAVYVTHDQSEAMAISDRVVVMNRAKIEQVGKNSDVYHRPATRFVADFMGAANFIGGTFQGESQGQSQLKIHQATFAVPQLIPGVSVGSPVTVVVRPETISVCAKPERDSLRATITGYSFLGSLHEYSLKLAENENLIARRESMPGEEPLAVGSEVGITFAGDRLTYLNEAIPSPSL